jgi:tetratricopeptide (TPR) repeat protein
MKEEAETCHLLGLLYEKKGNWERAFDYYVKAFKSAAKESDNALPLYQLGKALNKWREMKGIFEECPESHPEAFSAGQYLSDINRHLEDPPDADRPERNFSEGREEFEPMSNHSLLIGDAP